MMKQLFKYVKVKGGQANDGKNQHHGEACFWSDPRLQVNLRRIMEVPSIGCNTELQSC